MKWNVHGIVSLTVDLFLTKQLIEGPHAWHHMHT